MRMCSIAHRMVGSVWRWQRPKDYLIQPHLHDRWHTTQLRESVCVCVYCVPGGEETATPLAEWHHISKFEQEANVTQVSIHAHAWCTEMPGTHKHYAVAHNAHAQAHAHVQYAQSPTRLRCAVLCCVLSCVL